MWTKKDALKNVVGKKNVNSSDNGTNEEQGWTVGSLLHVPRFDGTGSLEEFVSELNTHVRFVCRTGTKAKQLFPHILSGSALKTYEKMPKRSKEEPFYRFIDEFVFTFISNEERKIAKETIGHSKQKKLTVDEFYESCKLLAYKAYPMSRSSQTKQQLALNAFVKGLHKKIRLKVEKAKPKTLTEAHRLAKLEEILENDHKNFDFHEMVNFVTNEISAVNLDSVAHGDVSLWNVHGPSISGFDVEFLGLPQSRYLYLDEGDVQSTRTPKTCLNNEALFHMLFHLVGNHNTRRPHAEQFTLFYPDFVRDYYNAEQRRGRSPSEMLEQYQAFGRHYKPERYIMPILGADIAHFVLAVFARDSSTHHVRVQIMDSFYDDSSDMIQTYQAVEIAHLLYGSDITVLVERSTVAQAQRQELTSRDCGIFTIFNAIRYMNNLNSHNGHISETMNLREEQLVRNTSILREEYASILEDIMRRRREWERLNPISNAAAVGGTPPHANNKSVFFTPPNVNNVTPPVIDISQTPSTPKTPLQLANEKRKRKRDQREALSASATKRNQSTSTSSNNTSSVSSPHTPNQPSFAPSPHTPSPLASVDSFENWNSTPQNRRSANYYEHRKKILLQLPKARKASLKARRKKFSSFEFDPKKMEEFRYFTLAVNVVRDFVAGEIHNVRKYVHDQLVFDVGGPEDMTEEEIKRRQLCRIAIHVSSEEILGKKYGSVNEVFARLWRRFMNIIDITNIDDLSDKDKIDDNSEKDSRRKDAENAMEVDREEDVIQLSLENREGSKEVAQEDDMDMSMEADPTVQDQPVNDIEMEEIAERKTEEDEEVLIIDESTEDEIATKDTSAEQRDVDGVIEPDEREKRLKKAADHAARNSPLPEHILPQVGEYQDIVDLLVHAHGDRIEEELNEDDEYKRYALGEVTFARECDDDCPCINVREAAVVHDQLVASLDVMSGTQEAFKISELLYTFDGKERSVSQWLAKYAECYQGLRSLQKRYAEISRLIDLYAMCDQVLQEKDIRDMKEFMTLNEMPNRLRMKFFEQYMPYKIEPHHFMSYVERFYAGLRKGFEEAMARGAIDKTCETCRCMKGDKDLFNKKTCRMCYKSKGLPGAAEQNMFMPVELPSELQGLNCIETMLIERARANQKIFMLKTISKQLTPMKATSGPLVVLPTHIEDTIDHVRKTLPSADFLAIEVHKSWGQKVLVSMPRVLAALKWLKANNPNYSDIEIDPKFRFRLGENVFFEDDRATQEDANNLVGEESFPLLDRMIEEQPIHHMHQRNDGRSAPQKYAQYRLLTNQYAPITPDTNRLDERIFPLLHPRGNDGYNAQRTTQTPIAKYVRTRLLHVNRRFATNANYLCFLYGRKQQLHLTSVQGIQARIRYGTKLRDFDIRDEKTQKEMSSAYAKIRGFPQYWKRVRSELRAHVAAFGSPTWFLTLNPNIRGWTDLHRLYESILKCEVNENNIERIIARDPVVFARYWRTRVDAFWKNVLLQENGPLGKISHYFYRVEYQHRGTQHIHCLLWTEKRPGADAKPSEVADFIDRHVTARLPDENTEKDLFDLVNVQQRHWKGHSNTCRRKQRLNRKVTTTRCRFGFPRPALRRTFVYSEDSKRFRMPGITNRPYYLARKENETEINDYSPGILSIWRANIDVQYIPADATDIVNYITAYTTKGEKAKRLTKENMNRYAMPGTSKSRALFNIGLDMSNQREVGLLELVDDLLGHPCYAFDIAHVFVPNDEKATRPRVLRPKNKVNRENDVIHELSMLDNYYPNRQDSLQNFSLFNIMANFHVVSSSSDEGNIKEKKVKKKKQDEWDENQNNDGGDEQLEPDVLQAKQTVGENEYHIHSPASPFYCHPKLLSGSTLPIPTVRGKLWRKRKQNLPRFYLPTLVPNDIAIQEDYYRRLVLLFVPWRDEDNILDDHDETTYTVVWHNYLKKLSRKDINARKDLDKLINGYTRLQNHEAELCKRMDQARRIRESGVHKEESEDKLEVRKREVNVSKHESNKLKLNKTQRDIFDNVVKRLIEQDRVKKRNAEIQLENSARVRNKLPRIPLLPMPAPIQMFISGTAGTGKSFLINTLADELTLLFGSNDESDDGFLTPPVVLSAPTGIAALAINGNTIHALLGIEVNQSDHRAEEEFNQLSSAALDRRKHLFSNMRLLISDEVSMVGNTQLSKIHKRLQEINGQTTQSFGGYNLIMFGDLMQLPPVRADPVFYRIRPTEQRRVFGTLNTGINLWQVLEYEELMENMRQGANGQLALMFERIRTGIQTPADIGVLRQRMIACANGIEPTIDEIADFYVDLLKKDPHAMALFPLVDEVEALNEAVLRRVRLKQQYTIEAHDTLDKNAMRQTERISKTGKKRPWMSRSIRKIKKIRRNFLQKRENRLPPKGAPYCDTGLQGGLPAKLVIGIGARVMLRRNLSIRDRLVNGATGVVKKIELGPDGTPNRIHVVYDGSEITVAMDKITARFQKNGEMQIRTQFPLVVAYGATIHKAQGLTLQNVIVRSRHMWSAGQFYVAVSRVTKLDGLHLAGFDPSKIAFDATALAECNRLRKTKGYENLRGGSNGSKNVISDLFRARNVEVVRDTDDADTGEPQRKKQRMVPISKATSRKQREVYELRKTFDDVCDIIPRVRSNARMADDRFCETVSMAIIHCLSMMEYVHNGIANFDGTQLASTKTDQLMFTSLQEIVMNKMTDVWEIGAKCSDSDHFNEISVIADFFMKEVVPEEILQLFSRKYKAQVSCTMCRHRKFVDISRPILWIEKSSRLMTLPDHIAAELRKRGDYHEDCDGLINGEKCDEPMNCVQEVGGDSRYFWVGQTDGYGSRYSPLPIDPFYIGDHRFLLVGAISMGDIKENEREPVQCWYKDPEGSGWIYYNISAGGIPTRVLDMKLENMHFYLFVEKPKERLNAKDVQKELNKNRVVDDFAAVQNKDLDNEIEMMEVIDDSSCDNEGNAAPEERMIPRVKATPRRKQQETSSQIASTPKRTGVRGRPISLQSPTKLRTIQVKHRDAQQPQNDKEDDASDGVMYLTLPNPNTMCFLNAAVNMIYRCISLRRSIQSSRRDGDILNALRQLFDPNNTNKSVAALRNQLPPDMRNVRVHQDSAEALGRIMTALRQELGNDGLRSILCSYITSSSCSTDGCTPRAVIEQATEPLLFTNLLCDDNASLQTQLDRQFHVASGVRCARCRVGEVKNIQEMVSQSEYHIITCMRPHDQKFRTTLGSDIISMQGARWEIIGLVQHIVFAVNEFGSVSSGHYWSWVKVGQTFMGINDNIVERRVHQREMRISEINATSFVLKRLMPTGNDVVLPPVVVDGSVADSFDLPQVTTRNGVIPTVKEPIGLNEGRVLPPLPTPSQQSNQSGQCSVTPAVSGQRKQKKVQRSDSRASSLLDSSISNVAVGKDKILYLRNRKDDCFLITIVNMMYSIPDFRELLIKRRKKFWGFLQAIGNIYAGERSDVAELRSMLPKHFGKGYQNIQKVFIALFDVIFGETKSACNSFSYEQELVMSCLNQCKFKKNNKQKNKENQEEDSDDDDNGSKYYTSLVPDVGLSFENAFNVSIFRTSDCDKCEKKLAKHFTKLVTKTGPYHVVVVENSIRFNAFHANDAFDMYGSFWRVISFAEWRPDIEHFNCWRKLSDQWVCIWDAKVKDTKKLDEINLGDYNISMMVFKKLNDEETSEWKKQLQLRKKGFN